MVEDIQQKKSYGSLSVIFTMISVIRVCVGRLPTLGLYNNSGNNRIVIDRTVPVIYHEALGRCRTDEDKEKSQTREVTTNGLPENTPRNSSQGQDEAVSPP